MVRINSKGFEKQVEDVNKKALHQYSLFLSKYDTFINPKHSKEELTSYYKDSSMGEIIKKGYNLVKRLKDKNWTYIYEPVDAIYDALIFTLFCSLRSKAEYRTVSKNEMDIATKRLDSIKQLLVKKNHDYGSSYQKVADTIGTIPAFSVRILDKCNRLEALTSQGIKQEVNDESIKDTINDLLGYYILFIITMPNRG